MVDTRRLMFCGLVDYTPVPLPGSVKGECLSCHQEVWISPAAVALIEHYPEMEVYCPVCGMPEIEKEIFKETNDEINDEINKDNEH